MKWKAIAASCATTLVAGAAWWLLLAPLPADPARAHAPVSAAVEIRYDRWRRPFVRAATFEDALRAEGWLHARERLWQMELARNTGNGELAAHLDAGMLNTDVVMWRVGVPQLARRLQINASPRTQTLVGAYVSGVNRAIEEAPRPMEFRLLGIEPRAWSAADVYAVAALSAYQSARNYRNELLRMTVHEHLLDGAAANELTQALVDATAALDPQQPLYQPLTLGSNGWAVAPQRSATGNALFAFDAHGAWSMPNMLFEVHLFYADDRQLRGWSVPGLPGIINGFNGFMAWGFTHIGDTQDLFRETRNGDQFLGRNGWYEARVETVDIAVRDGDPHTLTITHTENGPLVQDSPPLSLRWVRQDLGSMGLDGLFELNTADSFTAFNAALDRFPAPSANAIYADVNGRVAMRTVGLIPVRGAGDGLLPQRADDVQGGWRGNVSTDALPRETNPARGWVAAANARLPGPPLISADNAPGYRQARLEDLLRTNPQVSPDDMRRWQLDWHNGQAERLLPHMLPALAGQSDLVRSVDMLETWLQAPRDAPGLAAPRLFEGWYLRLAEQLFEPALPAAVFSGLLANRQVLNEHLDTLITDQPDAALWRGQRERILRESLRHELAALTLAGRRLHSLRWDDDHRLLFRHELSGAMPLLGRLLDRGPYPWGGGQMTLGSARFRYDHPYTATGGATVRTVIEMSQPMRVASVIPGGQSGHPASAHYDDQLDAFLAGELLPVAGSPAAAGEVVTTLVPQ